MFIASSMFEMADNHDFKCLLEVTFQKPANVMQLLYRI